MKPIVIDKAAERELAESVSFYEEREPGLGLDYERVVRLSLKKIQRDPASVRLRADGTRRLLMARFPYHLCFIETEDEIWVVAFAHTSRRPGYWRRRLRDP